jgi:hypothetical protein
MDANRMTTLAAILAVGTFLAVGVALFAGVIYWQWTSSPTYSLSRIRSAVDEHDVVAFEKHVDVDTVASRLIDDLMAASTQPDDAEDIGAAIATGMVELLKPRLVGMVKEQTLRLVEDGTFSLPEGEGAALGHLARLDPRSGGFRGIGSTEVRGKVAVVGLEFHDEELDADFVLELKLRDMGGYWRLVELSNIAEVLAQIEEITGPPPGTVANVTGCRAYVEAFNSAPCTSVDLVADDLCPATLDLTQCDMTPYFACMGRAVKCRGDFIDISEQSGCAMPSCG